MHLKRLQAEDEEFVNEEEAEVPVRRVPASFAARGATSEDADSTGHESQPAKPKDAPKLGHTRSERTHHGSDRGTFGEPVSDRSATSRDDAAARSGEPSGRAGEVSTSASGSVFDDLLGTERKRNRMKKRKKD
jgi:maltokinase